MDDNPIQAQPLGNLEELFGDVEDSALWDIYRQAETALRERFEARYHFLFGQCLVLVQRGDDDVSSCGITAAKNQRPRLLHIGLPFSRGEEDPETVVASARHIVEALDSTQNFKLEIVYNNHPAIFVHLEIPEFVVIPGIPDSGDVRQRATLTDVLGAIDRTKNAVEPLVKAATDETIAPHGGRPDE